MFIVAGEANRGAIVVLLVVFVDDVVEWETYVI